MRLFVIIFSLLIASVCFCQNTNISNGFVFEGEPYLAINPNNSQHIVVAWMGFKLNNIIVIKTRVSFDAGNTWSNKVEIPHTVSGYQSADPSIGFDNSGNVYLCFVDYIPSPPAGGVYVVKSTDGGLSWGSPVEVLNGNADPGKYPVDRPWMVIDNSGGINDGNIYVTTMNPKVLGPIAPPYNPYFIKSVDGGASFQSWRYLDTTNYLAGNLIPQPMPTPCVSANGTFYAVYPSYLISQSLFAQYFIASSATAGNTFNYNVVLQSSNGSTDSLAKKGYLLISNPADANHLCLAYPNFDNGDIDVYIVESTNAGFSWTTPIRVNDDPIANNRMQDLIWADFDNDGDLIVAWRDRRNAQDSSYKTSSEIYAAVRWKDSTNFSANFPVSDSTISYNAILENSGNDFMCIRMINDTAYGVWGDTRNNFLNIWFQKLDLSLGSSSIIDLANDVYPFEIYPNPSNSTIIINIGENNPKSSKIELLNALGQVVYSRSISFAIERINISELQKGNYFIKLTTDKGSSVKKHIIY